MSQRPTPFTTVARPFRLAAGLALVTVATALPAVACNRAHAPAPKATTPATTEAAADLSRQSFAADAEAWLTRQLPSGTTLSEHPDFFAAAHEAFYDAQDGLLIFVYRSASPGRWVAWVSFDPERGGVVATTATDL